MTATKTTYKNTQGTTPLITSISSGCHTPILKVKFCNLIKAFFYPNSPTIPRYSVTCIINPEEHAEFLKGIQTIEKHEGVESILKQETEKSEGSHVATGNILIKFQTRDKIPVYQVDENNKATEVELEDELAQGENICVTYDILRYTKKNSQKTEHGITFKPSAIYLYK